MTISVILPLGLLALGVVVGPWLGAIVDRVIADRVIDDGKAPDRVGAEVAGSEGHQALGHRCASCGFGFGRSSLYPVGSWFCRCQRCAAPRGLLYPSIDAATAVVFALLGIRFGVGWMLLPYLALGAVLVVLSAIDVATHLLPNIIVWPSFLAGLFVIFVISGQHDYAGGIYSAMFGALVFGGFIGAAHLVYEQGMGRGDVKLSLTLGLFLGWLQPGLIDTTRLVLATIILALLGGGLSGLAYNVIKRRGRAEIPFGPALAVATLASVLASSSVFDTVTL